MNIEDFAGLDIARYRLVLRATEAASLPVFLGSTLRGAFGHALKAAVCVMNHRACSRCMVQDRCLYPYLFETSPPEGAALLRGQHQAPHPFILTPESPASDGHGLNYSSGFAGSGELRGSNGRPPRDIHPEPSVLGEAALSGAPFAASSLAGSAPKGSAARLPRLIKRTDGLAHGVGQGRIAFVPPEPRIFLRPGDALSFDLVLLGRAIEYMPYIVFAVSEMARRGLGFNRRRFELDEVFRLGVDGAERSIYSGRTQKISTPPDSRINLADLIRHSSLITHNSSLPIHHSSLITLHFLSPTRIRIDGDPQSAPSFELLVRSLLRRMSMVFSVHGRSGFDVDYRGLIERAGQISVRQSNLRWWDFERYSNRQQRKMRLGGFVGSIEYAGPGLSEFLPLFLAGEILHVGSNTTFGLGSYRIAGPGGLADESTTTPCDRTVDARSQGTLPEKESSSGTTFSQ